jgi:hypothetical protein
LPQKIHNTGGFDMAKQNDAGVYKLKNGNWGYRYVVMVNGVRRRPGKPKMNLVRPSKQNGKQ